MAADRSTTENPTNYSFKIEHASWEGASRTRDEFIADLTKVTRRTDESSQDGQEKS
jgi:hypothetical protein